MDKLLYAGTLLNIELNVAVCDATEAI